MESVLSLDDGRWSTPLEEPHSLSASVVLEEPPPLSIKQLSPPPVLAQVQPEYKAIPPSKVADPRPGPAMSDSGQYQDLHVVSSIILTCNLKNFKQHSIFLLFPYSSYVHYWMCIANGNIGCCHRLGLQYTYVVWHGSAFTFSPFFSACEGTGMFSEGCRGEYCKKFGNMRRSCRFIGKIFNQEGWFFVVLTYISDARPCFFW